MRSKKCYFQFYSLNKKLQLQYIKQDFLITDVYDSNFRFYKTLQAVDL